MVSPRAHLPERSVRRTAAALSIAGAAILIAAAAAIARTGDLIQPVGTAGCISQDGSGPCADGHGLQAPSALAVSPDGKSVYVVAARTVARLVRDPSTGAITQPAGTGGCISSNASTPCAQVRGLGAPASVAVSPDGKNVYVASVFRGIAVLDRNPATGALTQPAGKAGCISEYGAMGTCTDGHGLKRPSAVDVSPDGKTVYVASEKSNAVARLDRNSATGALTQASGAPGCVGLGPACTHGHGLRAPVAVVVSPDGASVYAAARDSSAVVRLDRNTTTGAISQPKGTAGCVAPSGSCAKSHGLDGPVSVAVSPDGKSVYAASNASAAVLRLNRNPATGAISQPAGAAGCIGEFGAPCADGHALTAPTSVAVSPDGKTVYATAEGYAPQGFPPTGHGVAVLDRNPATGAISQRAGAAGCVSEDGTGPCADGHALVAPWAVAVSGDGKNVYVASIGSGALARFNRAP
jgi:DNA-binding beta-propeller fold protein YncE